MASLGLAFAVAGIVVVSSAHLRDEDFFSLAPLSVVLTVAAGGSAVFAGVFAAYGASGRKLHARAAWWALGLTVLLIVLSAVLAVLTVWWVIIPLAFLVWWLSGAPR